MRFRRSAAALLLGVSSFAGAGQADRPATYPVDHARFYPVAPGVLWQQVLDLTDELGLKPKILEPQHGVLVTKPQAWSRKLDAFGRIEHPPGFLVNEIQLHLFVPRHLWPARLYVNSRMRSGAGNERIVFNDGRFESWFLDEIAKRLGVTAQAIPSDPAERERLARKLAGDHASSCTIPQPVLPGPAIEPLRVIEETKVTPDYPEDARSRRETGAVVFETLIDEAGFPARVSAIKDGAHDVEFLVSAENTIRFWRYRPARRDGCPVPAIGRVYVDFRMR